MPKNLKSTHIYVLAALLLLLAMVSANHRKGKLIRDMDESIEILSVISGNTQEMILLIDSLSKFCSLPSVVITLQNEAPLYKKQDSITDPAGVVTSYQYIRKLASVVDQTENDSLYLCPGAKPVIDHFHHILHETENLAGLYNSKALSINYQLKRFPQNMYINLFHFEILPVLETNPINP